VERTNSFSKERNVRAQAIYVKQPRRNRGATLKIWKENEHAGTMTVFPVEQKDKKIKTRTGRCDIGQVCGGRHREKKERPQEGTSRGDWIPGIHRQQ